MAVVSAIIPAAGIGSRLFPVTHTVAKELLPIGSTPAIHYVIEEIKQAKFKRIILVNSPHKKRLTDYLNTVQGIEHEVVLQKEPKGLGHAVMLGLELCRNERYVAVVLPDDILIHPQANLELMLRVHRETHKAVVGLKQVPKHMVSAYGIVATLPQADGYYPIESIVEKPDPAKALSDLAVVGRYILPTSLLQVLREIPAGHHGEIQLTDALRTLVTAGQLVGFALRGIRLDVGTPVGLLAANLITALREGTVTEEWVQNIVKDLQGIKS